MKRINACIQRVYRSERGRWICAAVFAVALYLLAVVLQPVITFYDNDDLNIAWALAGYRSGAPSFSHPFINCITAAAVSALYTAFPSVPWWYAVQTCCMILSVACVANGMLRVCARRGWPALVPVTMLAILCAGMFYYALAQVMFTLTAATLGMASLAMVLASDGEDEKRVQTRYLIGSVLLLALSFLIRQSSGLPAACFWGVAMLYRLISAKEGRVRLILTAAVAGVLVLLLTVTNNWGRAHQNAPDFLPFENARAAYMDYPHDLHYENRALYESIDWDEPLQGLVDAWFYMDARVNADTLKKAVDGSTFHNLSIAARLQYAWELTGIFLGKYPIAVYLCVITGGALMLLGVICVAGKRWLILLAGVCTAGGAAALVFFLLYSGRMNLRAFMAIIFPTIAALLMLCACGGTPEPAGEKRAKRACLYGVCGILALPMLFSAYKVFRTVVSYDSVDMLATASAVTDYAIAHPDNVYIRDVYAANNFDALTVYPEEKPVNLIDWGGCDTLTRAREAQWRVNGFTKTPDASVFLAEDVYYICNPDDRYLPLLDAYMQADRGAAGYKIVDWIAGDVAVVRFVA